MTFASSGNGSSDHLTAELFWQRDRHQRLHVPYKGGGPAITDLLGGQVDASFQNVNAVLQHIKAGKLRALAVTGAKRSPVLPDVPTMAEAGRQERRRLLVAGASPRPRACRPTCATSSMRAVVAALNDPQVKQQLTALGLEIVGNTPEQFATFQQQEFARWKKVIEVRQDHRRLMASDRPRPIDARHERLHAVASPRCA